jgi:DNA-directed RNA polymerase subunit RPC12/RpoP
MGTISLSCGRCGQIVTVPVAAAGTKMACPECQGMILIPNSAPRAGDGASAEPMVHESPQPGVILAPADWPATPPPQPALTDVPEWVQSQWQASQPAHSTMRSSNGPTESSSASRGSGIALSILVPYAISMTFIAGWLFFQKKHQAASDHPLANIPDILGEYEPARRTQVSRRLERLPDVDAPLPDDLLVRLGETCRVGDLEVTPERVEQRRIQIRTVYHNGQQQTVRSDRDALVLHIHVRNCSMDVWFHPTDPAFDRLYRPRRGVPKPYTQLIADGHHSYGGPIEWVPPKQRQATRRVYVVGQDEDDQPLAPGAARRTLICTDPHDEQVLRSLQRHDRPEPIVWRVLLRRGLVNFQDRDWSVCAVIGVQFRRDDVQH